MRALLTAEMDKTLIEEIEEFLEVEKGGWFTSNRLLDEDELIDRLRDKEVLITSYDKVTRKVIESCPNLKLIACTRSNPVNIDYDAAFEHGIPIIHTPGRNADSAAEYTFSLMLNISRNTPFAYMALKNGKYVQESVEKGKTSDIGKADVTWALGEGSPYLVFKGFELKGKTLGIVGFGQIGKKVAELAKAFGMDILVYDPNFKIVDGSNRQVDLNELLLQSDFITLHAAVVPETIGLMNKRTFQLMKRSAYLINTSRGAIINEEDLIEALRNKEIAGAALDVFASEPLQADHPFLNELENVIITPHIAGATYDAITNHTKMIISDLKKFMNGELLEFQYKEEKGGVPVVE
ncbi:2-hydroxyacid dehydrogenase [Sporosarcina thermotolerans]|uniref:2-hydroxyacid dehydrogenase n=1 Tax=Sporosarcina thermotolerans TaxID=633404 RepID=A0AAW9A577_9BACL|nr:2-hydroxyacid dehydrogenase [Sporosarcina thermotolerans]MDW0116137.1 2-hydroxyacid dehydrogenase [Sporosarcina thermotolerans]WHT48108.1 2-hydroxyacid dehydrogenase [Sporosarcina thermotolerans]